MYVIDCDDDKVALRANIKFTLLDVLSTIVGYFGNEMIDPRYQKEIDAEIELLERIERDMNEGGDES